MAVHREVECSRHWKLVEQKDTDDRSLHLFAFPSFLDCNNAAGETATRSKNSLVVQRWVRGITEETLKTGLWRNATVEINLFSHL